ncbi:MAG: hypothetical protein ACXWP4_10045 [Polyangiales bacterium]
MSGGKKGIPIGRISHVGDIAATLLARMGTILGSSGEARLRLEAALREAGLTAIPDDPELVLKFVNAFLVAPHASLCGPRLVSMFMEDLEQDIFPQSNMRTRMRDELAGVEKKRVGLLDDEPFRRSSVARALIHAGLDVVVLEPDQLRTADIDALIALGRDADAATLEELGAPVVVTQPLAVEGEIVARSTAPRDIADAVLSILAPR